LFSNEDPSVANCLFHFKSEFALVIPRAKSQMKAPMKQWLESLLSASLFNI
jgi:hypothetical protein